MRIPAVLLFLIGCVSRSGILAVTLTLMAVFWLSGCQSNPPTREERQQIRLAAGALQRSMNSRSFLELSPYLAPEIQVGNLPPEMSLAGLKAGMFWPRSRIGDVQVLSARRVGDGSEARVALYAMEGIMTMKLGLDANGKIRSMGAAPLWDAPDVSVPTAFASDFVVSGQLMFVKATVNGRTGFFLFDTGASTLLLNRKYFRPNPENGGAPGMSGSVSGIRKRIGYADVASLQWGGLRVRDIAGELHDFASLEKPPISPLLGAISYNEVRDCAVSIDWKQRKIQVFATNPDGSKKAAAAEPAPAFSLPFSYFGHLPLIRARIGPREYALLFDSGAESNVLPDYTALGNHFRTLGLTTISDGSSRGGGTALAGVVDQMTIGGVGFRDMPVVVYATPYLSRKGFLGAPLLQAGRVEINFRARRFSYWR